MYAEGINKQQERCLSPGKAITAAEVLKTVQESMDDEFAIQLNPVIPLAEKLPACSGNMLETHFDKAEGCFDFACRINSDFDQKVLHTFHQQNSIPCFLSRGYCSLLNASETGFRYGIENVWFEYDFPFTAVPALFLDINRGKPFCPETIYYLLQHAAASFNYSLHHSLLSFLHKIKLLHLYVVYYGFMFSRNTTALRLTINGVRAHNLLQILHALGWTGSYRQVEKLKETYLNDEQQLVLSVDVDQQLSPNIGIEIFEDNCNPLIKALYNNGIISHKQQAFLSGWECTCCLTPRISYNLTQMHQRNVECIYKRLNHFKIALKGGTVNAKAYLYYCF